MTDLSQCHVTDDVTLRFKKIVVRVVLTLSLSFAYLSPDWLVRSHLSYKSDQNQNQLELAVFWTDLVPVGAAGIRPAVLDVCGLKRCTAPCRPILYTALSQGHMLINEVEVPSGGQQLKTA